MLKFREGKGAQKGTGKGRGGSERDWEEQEGHCQSTDLSSVIRGDSGMVTKTWDKVP